MRSCDRAAKHQLTAENSTASYILPNGGLAGMVWMYLVSLFGFSFAFLSMAEMASMLVATRCLDFLTYADLSRAPTSGGQYRCVL